MFISVLSLSISPLLSPSEDVNASRTDGCREHLITLTPCLCNHTQTRRTNTLYTLRKQDADGDFLNHQSAHTHTHARTHTFGVLVVLMKPSVPFLLCLY